MELENYVLEALQKAVIAAIAASDDSTLETRTKMVGRVFNPPDDGSNWLEVIHIPNNPADRTWGDEKLYRGFLRLILHAPSNDQGAYPSMVLLKSISSYFTKGLKISDESDNIELTITQNPNFMGVSELDSDVIYPLSIEYQSYVS